MIDLTVFQRIRSAFGQQAKLDGAALTAQGQKAQLLQDRKPGRRLADAVPAVCRGSHGQAQLAQVAAQHSAGRQRCAQVLPDPDHVGAIRREGAAATIVVNLDILGQSVATSISPGDCEMVKSTF